jgi:hypothetical protein
MYTLGKTQPTWHTLPMSVHVCPTYASCRRSPYAATFHTDQQSWTDSLLPRKSAPDSTSQPDWVVCETHLSFSLKTVIEAVRLSQTFVDNRLLGLLGTYHRYAIGTFNTCSRVLTPRSLTNIGGGYHIKNLRITTTLSPPFPSEGSTDPPNGPARSQIIRSNYQMNWRGNKS